MDISGLQLAVSRWDASERTIALFFGGSRDTVLRRTCELAADAAESLPDGETILYLNVLSSEAHLEHELQKVCRSRGGATTRRRVLAMTIKPDDLLSHCEFIEKTIASRGVRIVLLNAFDFAAMMPRRRMRLVTFLQRLRDFSHVDVAVGLRREPAESDAGSYAALAYQASAVTPLSRMDRLSIASEEEMLPEPQETSITATILRPYAMLVDSLKTNELAAASDTPLQEYKVAA